MSITRLSLLINKKTNNIKITKRAIAKLLAEGKEEKARIRVEQVIREDFTIEAYDILELQCELVAERMRFVDSQKEVPPDMEQAIRTIIWAADRAEVSELATVKSQFEKKYGAEFIRAAENNEGGCVNPKVVDRLHCMPPSPFVVTEYLVGIAEEYDVDYTPTNALPETEPDNMSAGAKGGGPGGGGPGGGGPGGGGSGGGGSGGRGSGGRQSEGAHTGAHITASPPVTAWAIPTEAIPSAEAALPPELPAARLSSREHGHFMDTSGKARKPGGGYEEATRGWDPPLTNEPSEVKVEDDPPPPYAPARTYTADDIPSPPRNRPSTLDIPAAPGYEDAPTKSESEDPPVNIREVGEGEEKLDDLATRFAALRNGL
ncbi:unnamed protein product [Ascophyllum nodosum]